MGVIQDFVSLIDTQQLVTRVMDFLPRLFAAGGVFLVFWIAVRVTRRPLRLVLQKSDFAAPLIHLIVDNVYRFGILVLGLIMAASQLGIDVGAALAGLGVVGIAVGFAAQDSVANTIAGFLIFWDKPFLVGHYITTQGEYGKVTNITMRTTRIRTPQNKYVVIPNRKIIEEVLINHSLHGRMRLDIPVGIAYKETVTRAREEILQAVRGIGTVLEDPVPQVVVTELGDSSVNLGIHAWIENAAEELDVTFRILEASKQALDEAGIEIPFPHMQLFIDDIKEPAAKRLRSVLSANNQT